MKRTVSILAILLGAFLIVDALAGGGVTALVDAAKNECVAEGWPADDLQLVKMEASRGFAGIGARGTVVFQVKDADPPKTLRVELVRYLNLVGWHVTSFDDAPEQFTRGDVRNHHLVKVDKDDRPPFAVDANKPFRIEFGRGSGMFGLDTARIDQNGTTVLHRILSMVPDVQWETAQMHLSEQGMTEVLKAIGEHGLMKLDKGYYAAVVDGTQWVLWIKQGQNEKSVYFNNHFPNEILGFAKALDALLAKNGLATVEWARVGDARAREQQKELWGSLRR